MSYSILHFLYKSVRCFLTIKGSPLQRVYPNSNRDCVLKEPDEFDTQLEPVLANYEPAELPLLYPGIARVGLEPTRSYDLRILSPIRLPIPTPRQTY